MTFCAFKVAVKGWKWSTFRLVSELGSLRQWCSLWIGINILFWVSVLLPFISPVWVWLDCSWKCVIWYVNGLQQENSGCVGTEFQRVCELAQPVLRAARGPTTPPVQHRAVSVSGAHCRGQMQHSLELPWVCRAQCDLASPWKTLYKLDLVYLMLF